MTQQTEKIHIIDISQSIMERLQYIHIVPSNVLSYKEKEIFSIEALKELYPKATFSPTLPADLIVAIFSDNTPDLQGLLEYFHQQLNPSGLLMFGGFNLNYILQDVGDFLVSVGFVNVVMDKEMLSPTDEVIYGHAWLPKPQKPVRIPISSVQMPVKQG